MAYDSDSKNPSKNPCKNLKPKQDFDVDTSRLNFTIDKIYVQRSASKGPGQRKSALKQRTFIGSTTLQFRDILHY